MVWLTWSARIGAGGFASVPRFLQKRVARVWPLHLVMLAAAVVLALTLRASGRADPHFVFAELPLHILLLQNWGFTHELTWNDPAWSISAEFGAYLIFPLLVIAVDWRRVPSAVLLAIAAVLLLVLHLTMHADTLGADITRFGLMRCLVEFTTGSTVCALWLRWRTRRKAMVYAAILAMVLAIGWIAGAPETLVVPALFAAVLMGLALTTGRRGNPFEGLAIHYLGEISYATYLSHFLLWKAFKLAFVSDPTAVSPERIALYLGLVLASSIVLYT